MASDLPGPGELGADFEHLAQVALRRLRAVLAADLPLRGAQQALRPLARLARDVGPALEAGDALVDVVGLLV